MNFRSSRDTMFRLDQKITLVTGAGSGIGAAIAQTFAQAGAMVLVADRDQPAGQKTVDTIKAAGGQADFALLDIAREDDCQRVLCDPGKQDRCQHRIEQATHHSSHRHPQIELRQRLGTRTVVREPTMTKEGGQEEEHQMEPNNNENRVRRLGKDLKHQSNHRERKDKTDSRHGKNATLRKCKDEGGEVEGEWKDS